MAKRILVAGAISVLAAHAHGAFPKRGHLIKTKPAVVEGKQANECTYRMVADKVAIYVEGTCPPVITVR